MTTSFVSEKTVKKTCLYAGLAALTVGIGMAFEYGRAMSMLHAVSLGLLAIGASVAFVGADIMRKYNKRIMAGFITAGGIACMVGEYTVHFGYTVGHRVRDSQEAGVQNATHKAVQENRDSEKANIDMWRKQLADLQAQAPWAATVKADALRDELKNLNSRLDEEKKGTRGRKAGCGKECERLQDQIATVSAKIGTSEQMADLSKRLEATQRLIDKKVEVAAKTEYRSSKIINQTQAFAQLATMDDKPSETAFNWMQLVVGAVIALFTTFLAPMLLTIAFADMAGDDGRPVRAGRGTDTAANAYRAPQSYSAAIDTSLVDRFAERFAAKKAAA